METTQQLTYPWDVNVESLNDDWYSIPFEIRSAMWDNVKKDYGWVPCGNPDNINTWALACAGAITHGIEISSLIVEKVWGYAGCDLKYLLQFSEIWPINPYIKYGIDKIIESKNDPNGSYWYFWHFIEDFFRPSEPWIRSKIIYKLEYACPNIWDIYLDSYLTHRDRSLARAEQEKLNGDKYGNYQVNVDHVMSFESTAKANIARWTNKEFKEAELNHWIEFYGNSKHDFDKVKKEYLINILKSL